MKKLQYLFLLVISIYAVNDACCGETLELSIEQVMYYARENDRELKSLNFSHSELMRSKKNLYRTIFPMIATSFSSTNIPSLGELDTRVYNFNVTLEQVLYDQFSVPLIIQNHRVSVEESKIKIELRKKIVEQKVTNLYLDILLLESSLRNKEKEYVLKKRYLELMHCEHEAGSKTILDVIDAERGVLEVELVVEELSARKRVLIKDLSRFIGREEDDSLIMLTSDADHILLSLTGTAPSSMETAESEEDLFKQLLPGGERLMDTGYLYRIAVKNDFDVRKLKINMLQNSLKKKLLGIQFLDNISLSYEVDFVGDQFFPANTAHTFAVNFYLDFGLLSSSVQFSDSLSRSVRSRSGQSESRVLESLDPLDEGRYVRIEAFTTGEMIKEKEKDLSGKIEVWVIKMNSLLKTYRIKVKQGEIFKKNEELFQVKLEIGEAKEIDYMEFLIRKTAFLIEMEELRYGIISLIWEMENILNMKITELMG
jgi:hypothetical protein